MFSPKMEIKGKPVLQRTSHDVVLLLQRMFRAALLDRALYKELVADQGATGQAFLVVVLAGIAHGVALLNYEGTAAIPEGPEGVPAWVVLTFISWIVFASVTYLVGTKLMATAAGDVSWSTLARPIGFAHTPILLRALEPWPRAGIADLIAIVVLVWLFVALVVAVREALDFRSPWRALGVTIAAFIPSMAIIVGLVPLAGRT